MLTEDNVSEAMQDAVANLSPPTVDLVSGGVARGREIRRRRKAGLVGAASALAVLATGAAGLVLIHPATQPSRPGDNAAAGGRPSPPGGPPAKTATPSANGSTFHLGPGPSKADIVADLETLLPAGFTVSDVSGEQGYAQLVATDATGSILIEVNVEPGAASIPGLYPCANRHQAGELNISDVVHCQDLAPLNGGNLLVTQETYPSVDGDLYCWYADYGRLDGVRIDIGEFNSKSDNGGVPSRATQALTIADLASIAQRPLWTAN